MSTGLERTLWRRILEHRPSAHVFGRSGFLCWAQYDHGMHRLSLSFFSSASSSGGAYRHHQRRRHRRSTPGSIQDKLELTNPYRVLGLAPGSSLADARKAFLQAAWRHHPDAATASPLSAQAVASDSTTPKKQQQQHDHFVQVRQAFERIRRYHKKQQQQNHTSPDDQVDFAEDDDGDEDFIHVDGRDDDLAAKVITGQGLDLSRSIRLEVIHAHNTLAQGGKDQGGYWEMARQLAERHFHQQRKGHDPDEDASPLLALPSSSSSPQRRKKHR